MYYHRLIRALKHSGKIRKRENTSSVSVTSIVPQKLCHVELSHSEV